MEKQNIETIKMVERSLNVLDTLRISKVPIGVNDIAKQCSLSPSTAFRILKTLEVNGWIYQCNDGRYITGQKISFMTERNNLYLALKEVSAITMNKYTQKYERAMNLIVREYNKCYVLQQSRTRNLVDYIPSLNAELPFYACAGGKILLSELPIILANYIIESCSMKALTPHTITDPNQYWQELREVAKQGYALDHMESSESGSCVSVGVRDCEGTIIAALSFSGFIGVQNTDDLLEYVPILKEAAKEISHNLFKFSSEQHINSN